MIIMKFGGSSLGTPDRIERAISIIKTRLARNPLIVVSAHGKTTDMLIAAAKNAIKGATAIDDIKKYHTGIMQGLHLPEPTIAKELSALSEILIGISMVKELTARTLDMVCSFGERMSSKIIAAALAQNGVESEPVEAGELGMLTTADFGKARPLAEAYITIAHNVPKYGRKILVVTGFIGRDVEGNITTLGRSGSDYSATILGAAINAEEIEIWKDVDGVMTSDPSVVPKAQRLEIISFAEANELAYYGAEVLHPISIVPAMQKNIPVRVLNTVKPESPGTVIVAQIPPESDTQKVKAIVYKEDLYLINIVSSRMLLAHGLMHKIFDTLDTHGVVVKMIATSEATVSIITENITAIDKVTEELSPYAEVTWSGDKAIICVVGRGMKHVIGVAGKIFDSIANAKINIQMISQGASEVNVAFLINNNEIEAAVKALHKAFFGA